ncbi:ribonuclease D [Vibrio sp. SS-MA-C1-2]|uniref:ribonuclease D n=1 Tax=Vibrio sp. SS-MA-C1-2 TaxID=2908646 RepID=UPI001F1B061C|nr:ribonuclease D [Vibrio sp. SS-MA-C1-2]UJF19933.1 ribonuclease D [Vibrio sp. SS-MA-C1-2]
MNFTIISDTEQLNRACLTASTHPTIMLDTEFVKTRTLYPRLGLIQLYDGENLSLIDPIAIEDMSSLWDLLVNPDVLKVLHACSEDLEVFLNECGQLPTPMFDTQIMAAFLGHGLSTGFAALVKEYFEVELDKGESRTDWMARPLSDKQLKYAAADVYYLYPLFEVLQQKVNKEGKKQALDYECQAMLDKKRKVADLDCAYLDIKNSWQLDPKELAILKIVAKWRQLEARKRNLALNFVVKEANLWKLARYQPTNKSELFELGFEKMEIHYHGGRLLQMVEQGKILPESEYPEKITRIIDYPNYKELMTKLRQIVSTVATKYQLAPEFIASKRQLNQLLSWAWKYQCADDKRPEVIKGWRLELVGRELLELLSPEE